MGTRKVKGFIFRTYNEDSDGKISTMEQPEGPRRKPPVTFSKRSGNNRVVEYAEQDRALITLFHHPSERHCQLEIAQLLEADVDSVLECPSEQKEGRGIL
jgi:hypothetical protein